MEFFTYAVNMELLIQVFLSFSFYRARRKSFKTTQNVTNGGNVCTWRLSGPILSIIIQLRVRKSLCKLSPTTTKREKKGGKNKVTWLFFSLPFYLNTGLNPSIVTLSRESRQNVLNACNSRRLKFIELAPFIFCRQFYNFKDMHGLLTFNSSTSLENANATARL